MTEGLMHKSYISYIRNGIVENKNISDQLNLRMRQKRHPLVSKKKYPCYNLTLILTSCQNWTPHCLLTWRVGSLKLSSQVSTLLKWERIVLVTKYSHREILWLTHSLSDNCSSPEPWQSPGRTREIIKLRLRQSWELFRLSAWNNSP